MEVFVVNLERIPSRGELLREGDTSMVPTVRTASPAREARRNFVLFGCVCGEMFCFQDILDVSLVCFMGFIGMK
jgi:hypothetical protein